MAAFSQFKEHAARLATGMKVNARDYLLFYNDLQGKGPSSEVSLAEFIGLCSAASGRAIAAGLAIPGVLRISGSMDALDNLEDILRVAKNAGAKRVLLPMSSLPDLQGIPAELMSSVSPELYDTGDPLAAARRALGL